MSCLASSANYWGSAVVTMSSEYSIYLYRERVDLRKGISGLSDEQINDLAEAPLKVCKPMPMFGCEHICVQWSKSSNKEGAGPRIQSL